MLLLLLLLLTFIVINFYLNSIYKYNGSSAYKLKKYKYKDKDN